MVVLFGLNVSLDAMKTRGFMKPLFISLHSWSEGFYSSKEKIKSPTLFLQKEKEKEKARREAIACGM